MMDKSAIEQIQLAQQIENANKAVNDNTLGDAAKAVALPDSFKLVDMEKYQPGRYRFRGNMTTNSITAFAAFLQDHNQDTTSCFIDSESMSAVAILNFGTADSPGHCDSKATIKLDQTAPYTALLEIVNKRLSQRELAEFIEDWRSFITCYSEEDEEGNRQPIKLPRALHTIRSLTIEAKATHGSDERNFGTTKTSMESIDVAQESQPPAVIEFCTEPYKELDARTFSLRVSVITDRAPALTLRIIRHEEHKEQMAEEFKTNITNNIGDTQTYIGKFAA